MYLPENTSLTFELDKVTRNVAKYPLHHVTYTPAKFEIATPNNLGRDGFTRNVTVGRTYVRTDDGPTLVKINVLFFLRKKCV